MFIFRWLSVLERVVKLELPSEDNDATDMSTSLSSLSSKPSQLNATSVEATSAASALLPAETGDIYENIYESLD